MSKAGRPRSGFLLVSLLIGLLCCRGLVAFDSQAQTAQLAVTGAVSVVSETTNLCIYDLSFTITNQSASFVFGAGLRVVLGDCIPVASAAGCGEIQRQDGELLFAPRYLDPQGSCVSVIRISPPAQGPEPTEYSFHYELIDLTAQPDGQVHLWPDATPEDNTGQVTVLAQPWKPTVAFQAPFYSPLGADETDGYVECTVQRSFPSLCGSATVDYETQDGTAIAGVNYLATRGTLCFTQGQSAAKLRIPVMDDGVSTGPLTFTVNLRNPTGTLALGELATAPVTIADQDENVDGWIEPVSVLDTNVVPSGGTANAAQWPMISADGRYVFFTSYAAGLVPGITNRTQENVYRRDLWNHVTELVSRALDNASPANQHCYPPAISSDGNWAAFTSQATNLSPLATNLAYTAYLRDLRNHVTDVVSVNTNNMPSEGWASNVSDDGRYVVFQSTAIDLTANKFNHGYDLFLRDRSTGLTTLLNADVNGQSPATRSDGGYASSFAFIGNRYVFFNSNDSDLVEGDQNSTDDVFVYDLATRTVRPCSVSVFNIGTGGGTSRGFAASGDGRYVVFDSTAWDLVEWDYNQKADVFVRDLWSNRTTIVSVNSFGLSANAASSFPSMSQDGRYVAFQSQASDLVPEGASGFSSDIYVRDLETGDIRRALPGGSFPYLGPDGRFVVGCSTANLTPGFVYYQALYLADLENGQFAMLSRGPSGDNAGTGQWLGAAFDKSGTVLAYATDGALVPGDSGIAGDPLTDTSDIYVWRPGAAPDQVDLRVSGQAGTNLFLQDTNVSWSIRVANRGTRQATAVRVGTAALYFHVFASTGTQGAAEPSDPAYYNLGTLLPGAEATILFIASRFGSGPPGPPWVWAYAAEPDATPFNNRCAINLLVSSPDGDTDGDGMRNAWEWAHGLDPTSGRDALQDSDNDGLSNLTEYFMGTDPRDSSSGFRISSALMTPTNFIVRVPSLAGCHYGLECNTNFPSEYWRTVTNGVPGTGKEIELVDTAAPSLRQGAVYRATFTQF